MQMQLSPSQIFAGRKIFFIGGTGFLGKVTLSMLLDRFPDIARIHLMVRASAGSNSEDRFWTNIFPSPTFDPVRERYGRRVEEHLREKLVIVDGDITLDNLGLSEETAQQIADDIDLVLNSSGNVSFNPPLETALKTNVTGTQNLLAFTKRMKRPAFVHTSTCFVAGNRSGQIWEDDPVEGYFPRRAEMKKVEFSVEHEIRDCERLARNVVEESTDATLNAEFRMQARKRLIEEGRDPDEESTFNLATAREKKDWIRRRMSEMGLQRAQYWGWPNMYTYTKSMAEQLIARETGIVRSIVRPTIVESAIQYPFPGWNEGFNTTAPLILFALNGQNEYPINKNLVLDIIPVDYVASAILAVAAQACVEQPKLAHQLCSGDVNPNKMRRIVTLLGLYKRRHFKDKESGNRFLNALASRMEAHGVSDDYFRKVVPWANRKSGDLIEFLGRRKPYGTMSGAISKIKKGAERLQAFTREGLDAYEQFRPFTILNEHRYRADNVRALFARVPEAEREVLTWAPESIDWYYYWLEIHFPGLNKWVFPKMEEIGVPKPKRVYTYRNLMEMFDAVTKLNETRISMRIERDGEMEEYTYGDVRELTLRAAAFLIGEGVQPDDRVGLIGENGPEWGISYFGILKAGATSIPMDKDLTQEEITNLLLAGKAKGIILTEKFYLKQVDILGRMEKLGHPVKVWSMKQVLALGDEVLEKEHAAKIPAKGKPTGIASLIFTSGTTGKPKGVMLTHKNLTSMMAQLLKVYDVSEQDGFLSVLPLHHTFEFSTGFLLPFSRGAQITYLEELTGDSISTALKEGHVTIMVGVPALWDLLQRKILKKFGDKSEKLESFVRGLIDVNRWIRKKTPFNLGPFLFFPVHHGLGGKIRFLISGGSALSEKVFDTYYGLGFALNEGYGLTEASPVLTVTRQEKKPAIGSVGEALPGVDVRILHPNEHGIGEVVARGPNIMAGYYENKEATEATIIDGWLHTGDLGYVDKDGNLFLVGRSKDLIVGASGKNVYPDELEEEYKHNSHIKELSIVGLPDEGGERIACVVVPDYEYDTALLPEQVQKEIEDHFRKISSGLPYHKRIKTLEFWEGELPRTGTRKVKRREVIARLQKTFSQRTARPLEISEAGEVAWLYDVIASVCGKPASSVHLSTSFDELGFDSLMVTELGVAVESAGRKLPSFESLSAITTVRELAELLHISTLPAHVMPGAVAKRKDKEETVEVPSVVASAGRKGLEIARKLFYNVWMETEIHGAVNIPPHTNFIVAPNHCSHLDMGLVKTALGDAGKNTVAVAAADYFFNTKYKRAFFDHFTNLIPMERKGSLKESLSLAHEFLDRGYNLLIFPEGTRSANGCIADFKVSLGYLAMRGKTGILPMYLGGTFDAMPKGANMPKPQKISATIGPFLPYESLAQMIEGLHKNEAYRLITALAQKIVEQLRDGITPVIDPDLIRAQWNREHQPQLEKTATVTGD
jgi:long-chain acyl-CoA synthetase